MDWDFRHDDYIIYGQPQISLKFGNVLIDMKLIC